VRLHERLAEKNALLRRESQRALRSARVDALTQVPNRLALQKDLETIWASAHRYAHPYTVAMCDIDEFKHYNDGFGHIAGDDALRRVAHAIRDNLRAVDTVYRYGGEEFVVLLPEQNLETAAMAMERIRGAVEALGIPRPGNFGPLTVSIGIAEVDVRSDWSVDHWLERADRALYLSKEHGKNRVTPWK
jgi:diguanylate cyclase (GGDEF)-like protein